MPTKDGRYWVYPYRSLGGYLMVALMSFKDGKWEETSRQQEYAFWKPLEIPKPPKVKYAEDTYDDSRGNANRLLRDLRRNTNGR